MCNCGLVVKEREIFVIYWSNGDSLVILSLARETFLRNTEEQDAKKPRFIASA